MIPSLQRVTALDLGYLSFFYGCLFATQFLFRFFHREYLAILRVSRVLESIFYQPKTMLCDWLVLRTILIQRIETSGESIQVSDICTRDKEREENVYVVQSQVCLHSLLAKNQEESSDSDRTSLQRFESTLTATFTNPLAFHAT